jgi:hypothetical protein
MKSPKTNISTLSHEFQVPLPYEINGKPVKWGSEVLGGEFLGNHGHWQADSTRGSIAPHKRTIRFSSAWMKSGGNPMFTEPTRRAQACLRIAPPWFGGNPFWDGTTTMRQIPSSNLCQSLGSRTGGHE